jgi:hypothetical protein
LGVAFGGYAAKSAGIFNMKPYAALLYVLVSAGEVSALRVARK